MAHFAGLVAGGQHPHPFPHAHVATATTYKNLRGVRGGIILWNDDGLRNKLNSAVFPGVQGSVMLNAIAAKAVCLGEALKPEFKAYAIDVLANARALAAALVALCVVPIGLVVSGLRGFCVNEFTTIGGWIADVLLGLAASGPSENAAIERRIRKRSLALCQSFPIYPSQLGYLVSD